MHLGSPHRLLRRRMPSSNAILAAVSSCDAVRALAGALPVPGEKGVLGGTVGSLGPAVVAALHRANPERTFVALTESPQEAVSAEADLEAILERSGESHLYPQKEALPYEESEPHLEIGGMRVEAVEALFSGRAKVLVTTQRALQERVPIPARLAELRHFHQGRGGRTAGGDGGLQDEHVPGGKAYSARKAVVQSSEQARLRSISRVPAEVVR